MLKSVLIANRGEIACRIIRTARRLGMRTIAVYSEADAQALHVKLADESHAIGPSPARESYLVAERILSVAKAANAECIHPGYGFLSENAEFAEACEAAGIVFVGPPASAIRAMGLKDAAKALVEKANVPVVPGYHGPNQDESFLRAEASAIGYPVLIKAVAGGGGKGMRRVEQDAEFSEALASAKREAASAFGNADVLIERYILKPRHVEMQVFADRHGNVVHLFERDCSLQRRHQKVIEEAPAPGMSEDVRAVMGRAATEAARAVGYVGAGTIEFIADGSDGLKPDGFFFMEMNTRLQVEHPVTEAITGLDLVELQFRIASGEPLPFAQSDLSINGHAVEARLYAEDPEKGFLPSTGKLWALDLPTGGRGIRVDTGVAAGDTVTPFYDPMIAKIIAHGATRDEALDRLSAALGRTVVAGPKTNTAFLRALCDAPGFRGDRFDTGFIDRNLESLGAQTSPPSHKSVAAGVAALLDQAVRARPQGAWAHDPWAVADGFAAGPALNRRLRLDVEGDAIDAELSFKDATAFLRIQGADGDIPLLPGTAVSVYPRGGDVLVIEAGRQTRVAFADLLDVDLDDAGGGDAAIKAPMHGKLVAVFVRVGDRVTKGQKLALVEAMKMEHALTAQVDGEVSDILAQEGAQVAEGAKILVVARSQP
ncbi:MAG: acetyl-CoA carboxylase biotin carboxylase subunit [Beijerinckiaceae bacterium]|nr:acetyl-CoA carboxylase biotin carboxylase subunit [Beijerinckiaceae bacterium]